MDRNGHQNGNARVQRVNELRSRKLLQASGFKTMQTKDDLFSLVAVGLEGVVLVRVQSEALEPDERERLRSFRVPPGTAKLVHTWRKHDRIPLVAVVP